jgi:hypothetical protein
VRLLQIVPRLPPPTDGVGDYALALGRALETAGISTTFLVPASALSTRTPAALAEAVAAWVDGEKGESAVLVHYVNYAYARRGCPRWLVEGLMRWRRDETRLRLIGLFHEVYASGPPWRSSFWLSPVQRRLAADLARTGDRLVTSLELYRDLLSRWVATEKVSILPVFSTVGEPATSIPLADRPRRLVVFGGSGTRARAYGEHGGALAAACAALRIAEILDVGPGLETAGLGPAPATVANVPVRCLGALPAAAVSALLADSLAGFIAHTPAFLGKSTVFAAYCAHGALPVAARRAPEDTRIWTPEDDADHQATADAAAAWYAGHSLSRQVGAFRRLLGAEGT